MRIYFESRSLPVGGNRELGEEHVGVGQLAEVEFIFSQVK